MRDFLPRARGNAKQVNIAGHNTGDIDASTTVVHLGTSTRTKATLAVVGVLALLTSAAGMWWTSDERDGSPHLVPLVTEPASPDQWGPGRIAYTHDRRPTNQVVLNSISNNPAYGDERNFFRVRDLTENADWSDRARLMPGRQYQFSLHYSNNSPDTVAEFLRARVYIPQIVRAKSPEKQVARGFLSSSNTLPQEVWDSVHLESTADVILRFVQASGHIHNNGRSNGSIMPSTIFSTGSLIGNDELNGILMGRQEGYIQFTVVADKPDFHIDAAAKLQDAQEWKNSVTATSGQRLNIRLSYQNTGTTDQKDVTIVVKLPDLLRYIANTSTLVNVSNPNGIVVSDGVVGERGINIGHYHAGAYAHFTFATEIPEGLCPSGELSANVFTANGTKSDSVNIDVSGC